MENIYPGYGKVSDKKLPGMIAGRSFAGKKKYDLGKHPFFTRWEDPASGAVSFILTERVAPVQFPFYFTNSSMSADGEYLWFYAAFPPNPHKFLGQVALNPEKADIKWFPQSLFEDASPMVAPDSSGVYFFSHTSLIFMDVDGNCREVGRIPEEYINHRHLYRICTHLSISADGKYFLVDGCFGNDFFVALMDVKSGEFKLLHEFPYMHNHGQFSPVDPGKFLLPRDWRRNPTTGKYEFMEIRLWLMDIDGGSYRPLCPDLWEGHITNTAHEWFSKDGIVCFVDYAQGVFECDPETKELCHAWKRPVCHAHCNGNRTKYCGDQTPYGWKINPVELLYFDREKNQENHIVTAMPAPPIPRNPYHLDPHPHFSPDEQWVIYMTTVNEKIDVAVSPVDQFE